MRKPVIAAINGVAVSFAGTFKAVGRVREWTFNLTNDLILSGGGWNHLHVTYGYSHYAQGC